MASTRWLSDFWNKKLNQSKPTYDSTFENILSKLAAQLLHPFIAHSYNGNASTDKSLNVSTENAFERSRNLVAISFMLEHPETRTCCFASIFCKTTNRITLYVRLSMSIFKHSAFCTKTVYKATPVKEQRARWTVVLLFLRNFF